MKSQFQIVSFLSQYTPASQLDSEMILGFLSQRNKNIAKSVSFCTESLLDPINAQIFLQWYANGYAPTDIAKYNGNLVILGACDAKKATIIGTLIDGHISTESITVQTKELSLPNDDDKNTLYECLYASRLQFDQATLTLTKKYIPSPNEKVIFYNQDFSQCGIGTVRSVNEETGDVELYCYYLYQPTNSIGFSMHETNVANLIDHIFEPMLDDDKRTSKMNGVSCLRRMNNELGKNGKVWKDKIRRIEPISYELEPGSDYWYISDELKVIQKKEKGTPTSHFRYLAGNYFVTRESAEVMREKIIELLQSYLASPEWPNIK